MKKITILFLALFTIGIALMLNQSCAKGVVQLKQQQSGVNGTENGYAWVDLGLPSGLKWATCNVGAENPWDYGDHFAWGEITPKSVYNWSTYLDGRITKEEDCGTDRDLLRGITDIKGSQYDAARANMGSKWRMPTNEEIVELYNNCYWEWTTCYNGKSVGGYIAYKAKNASDKGKMKYNSSTSTVAAYSLIDTHIFFPIAGFPTASFSTAGLYGVYWSSSLNTDSLSYAYDLEFSSGYLCLIDYSNRDYGFSVRGVCK